MGKKYGNYHLQYLFDDLHVIYMFFTYYVNFQLFQCITDNYLITTHLNLGNIGHIGLGKKFQTFLSQ